METLEKFEKRKRFDWRKACTDYLSKVWPGQGCANLTFQKICTNPCEKAGLTCCTSCVTKEFM